MPASQTSNDRPPVGLQIARDLTFHRREWAVQRAGWVVMALVVIGGGAGLFGGGPLSRAKATSSDGALVLEYERFARHQAPTELRVHSGPGARADRRLAVWLGREYVDGVQIQHVIPSPERTEAGADRLLYVFADLDPARPAAVTFVVQPENIGVRRGRVGLPGAAALEFTQLVYP